MYHYVRTKSLEMPNVYATSIDQFDNDIRNLNPSSKNQILNSLSLLTRNNNSIQEDKCISSSIFTFDDGLVDHYSAANSLNSNGSSGIFFISSLPYLKGKFLDVHLIHLAVYKYPISLVYSNFLKLIKSSNKLKELFETLEKNSNYSKHNYYNDDDRSSKIKIFLNRIIPIRLRYQFLIELHELLGTNLFLDTFYLSPDQILSMDKMGMIIGSHSHSHTLMSSLSRIRQGYEIERSTNFLFKLLGFSPKIFSFPYGRASSFNEDTINLLKQKKYSYAFSVESRDIELNDNPFEIPRYNSNETLKIY